jgi:hypothetical protein
MPLPPESPREPIHQRRVECRGYRRADGLWDIEGHLVDVKSYGFENAHRGRLEPGMPIHEMWIRLTIDDDLLIHEAVAATDASPYRICPEVAPNFARLKGLKIGAGFRRAVAERVGGTAGCTHIVELLGPLATTAIQTIMPIKSRERPRDPTSDPTSDPTRRPPLLDSCYALRADGEVAKRQWPQFYTGP